MNKLIINYNEEEKKVTGKLEKANSEPRYLNSEEVATMMYRISNRVKSLYRMNPGENERHLRFVDEDKGYIVILPIKHAETIKAIIDEHNLKEKSGKPVISGPTTDDVYMGIGSMIDIQYTAGLTYDPELPRISDEEKIERTQSLKVITEDELKTDIEADNIQPTKVVSSVSYQEGQSVFKEEEKARV